MFVILSVLAAVGYGVSDFAGGLASRRARPVSVLLLGDPCGAVVTIAVAMYLPATLTARAAIFGAAAGIAGLVGLFLMYHLMATQPLNLVSPLTAVLTAATPLGFGIAVGQHLRAAAWLGVVAGLCAICLVSMDDHGGARVRPRVLLTAAMSGGGFGAYFVLLGCAGPGSGLWPLISARLVSVALVVLVGVAHRAEVVRERSVAGLALLAGGLDALGDLCFLLATHRGHLSLTGVIAALYPAVTVVLALLLLRERARWRAGAGLALSALALALIAS